MNDANGTMLFSNNTKYHFKERSLYITNRIANIYLTSLKSYYYALSNVIDAKYNNPLYLNNKVILIATRAIKDYNNIWINFSQVKNFKIEDKLTTLYFYSGNELVISISKNYLGKQIKKIKEIEKYLKKLSWKRIYKSLL